MTNAQLLSKLRKMSNESGSQRSLAAKLGITAAYLNDVLLGHRAPGKKLLKALGMSKVVEYR